MFIAKISNYISYLSHKPFDTTTPEGCHRERYRLALWSVLANTFSTGISMFALLITVPMTLPYLGKERFGVWMTVSSIAALLSFLDFGIGNGLINRVAHANSKGDSKELSFIITHGLALLTLIGLVIGLFTFPLMNYLPWEKIIKVSDTANSSEIHTTLFVFLFIFVASIPLNTIQKIFQGMQLAWQAHLIRGLGSFISLIAVYLLAKQHAGVPSLLFATFGIQTVFPLILLCVLIKMNVIQFSAFRHQGWISESSSLIKTGGLFFLLQISGLLVWSIDSIIISSTLGAASVTKFALIQRLFQFVLVPLAIINSPLWSAYADAHIRGDKSFIAQTLKKSLISTMLIALTSVVLISSLSSHIFRLWIHDVSIVPSSLVWSYGLLIFLMATGNSLAMFLNGVGEIKSQVYTVSFFCLIAVPLKYFSITKFGIVGLIWTTIISYAVAVLMPYFTFFRPRLMRYFV